MLIKNRKTLQMLIFHGIQRIHKVELKCRNLNLLANAKIEISVFEIFFESLDPSFMSQNVYLVPKVNCKSEKSYIRDRTFAFPLNEVQQKVSKILKLFARHTKITSFRNVPSFDILKHLTVFGHARFANKNFDFFLKNFDCFVVSKFTS